MRRPGWRERSVAIGVALLACHAGGDALGSGRPTTSSGLPTAVAAYTTPTSPTSPPTTPPPTTPPPSPPPQSSPPVGSQPSDENGRPKKPRNDNWLPVAAVVGVVAIALIHKALTREKAPESADDSATQGQDAVEELKRSGPTFAARFNMSAFNIRALVRGGWPVVIDYELGKPGAVELKISARGIDEVYTFDLSRFDSGRHMVKFIIPADVFGGELRPALVAVTAIDAQRKNTLDNFRIHGMGIGPRAVGSVAIDQVTFGPPRIRTAQSETAAYQFHSLNNFGNTSVEFMKIEPSKDGSRQSQVGDASLGPVRKNQWIGDIERRAWNGKTAQKEVSTGRHKLRVRVWDVAGDWVAAWSDSQVIVAK